MKVLITGGRKYRDSMVVYKTLSRMNDESPIKVVIGGGCTGADSLAIGWGRRHGCWIWECQAAWGQHGHAAGPIRNEEMITMCKPDVLLAFPGGRGTANMIMLAKKHGLRTMLAGDHEHG